MAEIRIKQTDQLAAANAQREGAKNRATFDMLAKKPRLTRDVTVKIPGDDGEPMEVVLVFSSIGARAYDRLIAKHPPNTEQKAEGSSYNLHTFGPALIAACCQDPILTEEQVKELWESPDWNRGEVMSLFSAAVEICNQGLDIPFSALG